MGFEFSRLTEGKVSVGDSGGKKEKPARQQPSWLDLFSAKSHRIQNQQFLLQTRKSRNFKTGIFEVNQKLIQTPPHTTEDLDAGLKTRRCPLSSSVSPWGPLEATRRSSASGGTTSKKTSGQNFNYSYACIFLNHRYYVGSWR